MRVLLYEVLTTETTLGACYLFMIELNLSEMIMLDNKYAVKYKMPHSLLHIVDNSGNRENLPTTVADDPSLYSTIVVTATPMGADNRIINLNRADVAAISFGLNNVTAEDVRKYGQSIEYPLSLIENAQSPVKLLRVTPDGSTYAYTIILVQWKIENEELHVRFVKGDMPAGIRVDRFKNPEKLNDAIINKMATQAPDGWNQKVFMNVIAAGRGKIYNDFAFAINFGQQGKRPSNCRYIFSTINTNTSLVVERFAASISNETTTTTSFYEPLDDVNTVVGKRVEGSSILIPFLNKDAVNTVYKEYTTLMNAKLEEPESLTDDEIRYYKTLNINIFDMVYGHYIYEGSEYDIRLPHYLVDMIDTEIAQLPERDRFQIIDGVSTDDNLFDSSKPYALWNYLYPNTYGVTHAGDAVYVGSTYISYVSNYLYPVINVVTNINQYTGAVTSIGFDRVFVKDMLAETNNFYSKKLTALIPDANIDPALVDGNSDNDYTPLVDQPDNWTTNFSSYYVKNENDEYVEYTGVAPDWASATYYSKSDETYTLTQSKPDDWDTNFAKYYTARFNAVTGETAPAFEAGKYFSNSSTSYTRLYEEPADWTTDYTSYYVAINSPAAVAAVSGSFVTGQFYERVFDPSNDVKDILNNSAVLNRLIRIGVFKPYADDEKTEDGFYAIAFTKSDGTYGVCSIRLDNGENDAVTVTKVGINTHSILSVIDFTESRTGNLIGKNKSDAAFIRPGYTCIVNVCADPSNIHTNPQRIDTVYVTEITDADLYVNGYDTAYDVALDVVNGKHIAVTGNTDVCGNVPTGVNITNSIIGHEYDIIVYPNELKSAVTTASPMFSQLTTTATDYGSVITANSGAGYEVATIGSVLTDATITSNTTIRFKVIAGDPVTPTDQTLVHPTVLELVSWNRSYDGDFDTQQIDLYYNGGKVVTINASYRDMKVTSMTGDNSAKVIVRYSITGSIGSLNRAQVINNAIPVNYYTNNFGENPSTEAGGFRLDGGSTGFFDDDISSIEFKWRYSELLVKAYRGEIDPRIMSPARCPAKYMFDGGTNTIVGQNIVGNVSYRPVDIINASTIFTEEEKDEILYDESIVTSFIDDFTTTNDIDVKQAMYDLMVYRCYYGMPEEKRPIGPGYGLSLHLDAGITNATTTSLVNSSYKKRFTNPNASWDIGGYTSSVNGVTYTYTKWIVDHMIAHCKATSVNKPFVMTYATIPNDEYTSFFPDLDITDWDMRELLYTSGGNAWVPDINGNLMRRSQRTMKSDNELSDLVQESNMRTLSQLCYILQNTIDEKLYEYNDDGVLKTLTDLCNNKFSNWVGNLVEGLEISFERDINPLDGGEIVVCYCNVTFRGLILRVPIIVNVQHRNV